MGAKCQENREECLQANRQEAVLEISQSAVLPPRFRAVQRWFRRTVPFFFGRDRTPKLMRFSRHRLRLIASTPSEYCQLLQGAFGVRDEAGTADAVSTDSFVSRIFPDIVRALAAVLLGVFLGSCSKNPEVFGSRQKVRGRSHRGL